MDSKLCKICLRPAKPGSELCQVHEQVYLLDKAINGYRLRKVKNGTSTRHVQKKLHQHELSLTKIIERFYGSKNVITGFHPLWAVSAKGALLEFDICIPDKKLLIEYNGEQHYTQVPYFHRTKKEFMQQKRRDKRKAKLAQKNGYLLIVFKYDEPLFEDYIVNKIERELHGSKI